MRSLIPDDEWHLLDIGERPGSAGGDPGLVDPLRRRFDAAASALEQVRSTLQAADRQLDWQGEGADAFSKIVSHDVPDDLAKLRDGLHSMASALGPMYGAIDAIQREIRALGPQARVAQDRINRAVATGTSDDSAAADLHQIRRRARQAFDQYWREVDDVANAVERAMDPFKDDVGSAWDADVVQTLRAWAGVLKVIADIAAIAGLAALVLCSGGTLALVIGGVALLADTGLAVAGEGSWTDVGLDVLTLGHGGLVKGAEKTTGRLVRGGEKAKQATADIERGAKDVRAAKEGYHDAIRSWKSVKDGAEARNFVTRQLTRSRNAASALVGRGPLAQARRSATAAQSSLGAAKAALAGKTGAEITRQGNVVVRWTRPLDAGLKGAEVGHDWHTLGFADHPFKVIGDVQDGVHDVQANIAGRPEQLPDPVRAVRRP